MIKDQGLVHCNGETPQDPNINFNPPHVQEALFVKAIVVEPNASFAKLDIDVS